VKGCRFLTGSPFIVKQKSLPSASITDSLVVGLRVENISLLEGNILQTENKRNKNDWEVLP
jgi:hypothetical protein